MTLPVRILLSLVILFWFVMGATFTFAPDQIYPQFFIEPKGVEGLATIRADFGGLFVAGGIMALLGLLQRNEYYLYSSGILMFSIEVIRGLSAIMDGLASTTVQNMAVEMVVVAILFYAARKIAATKPDSVRTL